MTSQDHLAANLAARMRDCHRDLAAKQIRWPEYYQQIEGLRLIAEQHGLSLAVNQALRRLEDEADTAKGSAA